MLSLMDGIKCISNVWSHGTGQLVKIRKEEIQENHRISLSGVGISGLMRTYESKSKGGSECIMVRGWLLSEAN